MVLLVQIEKNPTNYVKVEHHHLGANKFYSGATFVSRNGGQEEDDGWIVSFVHDEDSNTSQVSMHLLKQIMRLKLVQPIISFLNL